MFKNIFRNIRLFSFTRKEPYLSFHQILGFYPDKIDYYELAVRHRSASITTEDGFLLSNERLEFLGDAVLNSVITDIVYHRYENEYEGFLTNMRSRLVKRDTLNQLALQIGLDKLMLTSKHVVNNTNKNIYGNALEALMGAVYLDFGYKRCKSFVSKILIKKYIDLDKVAFADVNFKSKIIEWSQKYHFPIEFVLAEEELLTNNQHNFKINLLIAGKLVSEGNGVSKKESHQDAAFNALKLIDSNPNFVSELQLIDDSHPFEHK